MTWMSHIELQLKLVYSLIVAGKTATFANEATRRLFQDYTPWPAFPPPEAVRGPASPFEAIWEWCRRGELEERLRAARTGNYGKLFRALVEVAARWRAGQLDLHTCAPEELETIPGIGPKTSRFFILWTRPEAEHAALDVHVLRWLREQGHDAPEHTPQNSAVYARLERIFIQTAKDMGLTPRQLDLQIWEAGSTAANKV